MSGISTAPDQAYQTEFLKNRYISKHSLKVKSSGYHRSLKLTRIKNFFTTQLSYTSQNSVNVRAWKGCLFKSIAALPLVRRTDSFWKRCLMASLLSSTVCLALAEASFFTCATVSSCQPPRVSHGIGTTTIPSLLQASPA